VIYLALFFIVVGVALFVAAPLFENARGGSKAQVDLERSRLEHERALAVQEFDHEMRKLSEQDWAELKRSLEERALRAMAALEKLDKGAPERRASARKSPVRAADGVQTQVQTAKFCPGCGKPITLKTNFCAECGAPLKIPDTRHDALSHG
jgi:NADH pyrophosphatase NudC (nudix superfamily)